MEKSKAKIRKELRTLRNALKIEQLALRDAHIEDLPLPPRVKESLKGHHQKNIAKLQGEIQARLERLQALNGRR